MSSKTKDLKDLGADVVRFLGSLAPLRILKYDY